MKIIILTPLLQPYRVTFYEKLHKLFPGIKVFYNSKLKEDGRPGYDKKVKFPAEGFQESKFSFATFNIIRLNGMYSAVKKEKPDIIISQGIPGNITYNRIIGWAKKNNVKIIFWYCGWEPNIKRNKILLYFKRLIALNHYKKGDYFLTYSTKAKNELINSGINPKKIEVAFNGIELDSYLSDNTFHKESLKIIEQNKDAGNIVFLFVGGLINEKRILFLIKVFNQLSKKYKQAKLWIIGDGPQKEQVEKQIAENKNIKSFGRIIDGVEPYFIAADFFVLPGTGGLALNQAMFFETPCVCTKADGTEDDLVIDGLTGFRFDEDNEDSLFSKLEQCMTIDPKTLINMKEQGKKIIQDKSNVNNMVSLFKNTILNLSTK